MSNKLCYQLLVDGRMFARFRDADFALRSAASLHTEFPGAIVHLFDGAMDLIASYWPPGSRPPEALLPRGAPPSLFAGMPPSAPKEALSLRRSAPVG